MTTLTFVEDLSDDNFKLFQFPDEIMERIEKSPSPTEFVIKSHENAQDINAPVVLCTDDKTYSITKVETSNTILLMNDEHELIKETSDGDVAVDGMVHCHYEVTETMPRLMRLRELLQHSYYTGEEEEDEVDGGDSSCMVEMDKKVPMDTRDEDHEVQLVSVKRRKGNTYYTLDMLAQRLQASKMEILRALHDLKAIQVNGYWRLVDPSTLTDIVDVILATVASERYQSTENDADANEDIVAHVPWRKVVSGFNYNQRLVRHCLSAFSVDGNDNQEKDTTVYKLSFSKIAVYRAKQLLMEKSVQREKPDFKVSTFLRRWKDSISQLLPATDDPSHPHIKLISNLDFLRKQALCVVDKVSLSNEEFVRYFDRDLLPIEARQRFAKIFECKLRWTFEELEPYIKDLVTLGTDADKVLGTYTRSTQTLTGGEKLYTLK